MDFAMGWNRFNLTLLGVWPEPRKVSRGSRLLSSIIFWFTTIVTFTFICAPQTANLVLKSTNLDEVIENLSINIPIAFALVKQIVLRYYKKGNYTYIYFYFYLYIFIRLFIYIYLHIYFSKST